MQTAHSEVRAEPVNFEDQYNVHRADLYHRDWLVECARLPEAARPTLAEYIEERIAAEEYDAWLDETREAAPPVDIEPVCWDDVPL